MPPPSFRNQVRDPVEHALWARYYPLIAEWVARPYFKDVAITLNMAAARQLYPAANPEKQLVQDRQWRRAEARFMAMTEYKSVGAVSSRLAAHDDPEGAARIRGLAAVVAPVIEAAKRREEIIRSDIKKLLADGGFSTLLSDERYEPAKFSEHLGDTPAPFSIAQLTIRGPATLAVKDFFAPRASADGIRLLCDISPTGLRDHHRPLYDQRMSDGLPSHRLFTWFKHDPERWEEFQHYHHRQLHGDHKRMLNLLNHLSAGPTTLLHMRRGEHSVAQSLHNYLFTHYPHVFHKALKPT